MLYLILLLLTAIKLGRTSKVKLQRYENNDKCPDRDIDTPSVRPSSLDDVKKLKDKQECQVLYR